MTEELLVPEEVGQHPAWVRLNDQLGWYDHKSAVNQKRYKQIQAAQIILATSIPVFSLVGAASGQVDNGHRGRKRGYPGRLSATRQTTMIYGQPTALPQRAA